MNKEDMRSKSAFMPPRQKSHEDYEFHYGANIIKQILEHLGLWQQKPSLPLPSPPKTGEPVLKPCYDDWPI